MRICRRTGIPRARSTAASGSREILCVGTAVAGSEDHELYFQTLAKLSPTGICLNDANGDCIYVNQRWCQMAGMAPADALGQGWLAGIHPEDREQIAATWRKVVERRMSGDFEYRMQTPQGAITWVYSQYRPLTDDHGRLIGYLRMNTDVTQRKLTEMALRASEQRFGQLLAAVTSYRYQVRLASGRPVATEHSAGCLPTTGYTPQEYLDDPFLWVKIVFSEDWEQVQQHVFRVLRGEQVPPLEHRILHKNGSVRWIRDTIISHVDESGALVHYDGLVEDITERKELEQRFWRILESAPDAMLVVDEQGQITLVNAQAERMFGYTRQELLQQPIERLIPDGARARHAAHRMEYTAHPRTRMMNENVEFVALRRDGSQFPAEICLSPLQTPASLLVSAAIRDITLRKATEKTLRERDSQLLAAQRIQQYLLPHEAPRVSGYDIAGALIAAEFAAGDYYDYLTMPDGSMLVVVGDVAGHGFSSALGMATTSAHLRSFAEHYTDVAVILQHTNAILCKETEETRFVTLFLLQLDPVSRRFRYINAGHPPGFVLQRSGELQAMLSSTSVPLAVVADAVFTASPWSVLDPGNVVLLITDGIPEARAPDGSFFGTDRALEVVRSNLSASADQIVQHLQHAVQNFTGRRQPQDDITCVVLRVQPAD